VHANANGTDWNSAHGWEIYVYKQTGKALQLAQDIHTESIPYLGLQDRGIKTADFAVLAGTKMPAVLIEHGFYTNKEECALLCTSVFREKCAIADAKGILKYCGIQWMDDAVPVSELVDANDLVYVLAELGVVEDKAGLLSAIEAEPNGRIYWLCRKAVNYIRQNNLNGTTPETQSLTEANDIVYVLGELGIVSDKAGMLSDIANEPNGRLYWLARKITALLQSSI